MQPWLNHDIKKYFADYINKTIEMHVVISFVVNKPGSLEVSGADERKMNRKWIFSEHLHWHVLGPFVKLWFCIETDIK